MNIQKYTEKAQEAIVGAQSMADREGHPEITPEHLLLTLVEQEGGIVPEILRKMNADPAAIARSGGGARLGKNPPRPGGPPADAVGSPPAGDECRGSGGGTAEG